MDKLTVEIIVYTIGAVLSLGTFGIILRRTQLPAYKPIMVWVIESPCE